MIEDFGGTVTGSVSGKTDYIVVGKEPGRKKVSEGEKRGIPLLGLMSLRKLLTGDDIAGDEPGKLAVFFFVSCFWSHRSIPPPIAVRITHFSKGYGNKRIEY